MFDVSGITGLAAGCRLDDLDERDLAILQRGLGASCYDVGPIDGLIGPRTRTAYADLIEDAGGGDASVVDPAACARLARRAAELRDLLARPATTADEVRERLREGCAFAGLGMPEQIAYVLATADHETNRTFRPVEEAYWVPNAAAWRRRNLRYYPFYGRGYVQLTWERNYRAYSELIGIDLVADPDAALRHDVSLFVIFHGMKTGGFTGRKLEDHVRPSHVDFVRARRVINGNDRADDIAALARGYVGRARERDCANRVGDGVAVS